MKYKLSNIVIPVSRPSRHDSCNNKLAGPIGSQEDPHTTLSHAVSSALWYVKHRRKHACIHVYTQKAIFIIVSITNFCFPFRSNSAFLQIPRTESSSVTNGRIAKIEGIITKQKCMHICNSWEKSLYDVKCMARFSSAQSYLRPSSPQFKSTPGRGSFSSFFS